jgi:hypothetical protein
MTVLCQVPACGRPCDGNLCRDHIHSLKQTLAEMPYWLDELQTTITRQDRFEHAAGRYDDTVWDESWDAAYLADVTLVATRMPYAYDPAALADDARVTLSVTIRDLCETRRVRQPRLRLTSDMSLWLLQNVNSIAQDEGAAQTYDELTWLAGKIKRTVDLPAERDVFLGYCEAVSVAYDFQDGHVVQSERPCGMKLTAPRNAADMTCDGCGTVYDTYQRFTELVARADDKVLPVEDVVSALAWTGVPAKVEVIRMWASRDADRRAKAARNPKRWVPSECPIYPHGTNDRGLPLYRVGDVRLRLETSNRWKQRLAVA